MVTYKASIPQLKARVETQKYRHKSNLKIKEKKNFGHCRACITSKTKFQKYENYLCLTQHGNEKARGWNGTSSNMVVGEGSSPVVDVTLNVWTVGLKEGPEGEFPP